MYTYQGLIVWGFSFLSYIIFEEAKTLHVRWLLCNLAQHEVFFQTRKNVNICTIIIFYGIWLHIDDFHLIWYNKGINMIKWVVCVVKKGQYLNSHHLNHVRHRKDSKLQITTNYTQCFARDDSNLPLNPRFLTLDMPLIFKLLYGMRRVGDL